MPNIQDITRTGAKDANYLPIGVYTHSDGSHHRAVHSFAFPEGGWKVSDNASQFDGQWATIGGHFQL